MNNLTVDISPSKLFVPDGQLPILRAVAESILPDAFDLIHPHVTRMLETKKVLEKQYDCLPSYANFVKPLIKPNYNVDVQKIENFYRFTLVDKDTLNDLFINS